MNQKKSISPFMSGFKRYTVSCLLLFFIFSGLGCGKSVSPDHSSGPQFPDDQYLKAQASGKTQIDARKQALSELSGIFESRVSSSFMSFSRSAVGQDQAEIFDKEMESRIRIASDIHLQGAKIGRTWKDDETGLYHALAVLDRMDAGRTWTSKVEGLDHEIRAETLALETMEGRLSRMASLNRVIELAAQRRVLESRLRVVDYPVEDLSLVDLGAVMVERSQLTSGLRIFLFVQGDDGDRVRDSLARGLSQKGIRLVRDPDEANAQVLGSVEVALLTLENENARFVRAQGRVQLFETQTQTLFSQINEKIRKGHKDENEARHRAVESLSKALSDGLLAALGYGAENQERR